MKKFLFLVVLAVLSACADVFVDENLLADGKYTLTVNASKGPVSKALDLTESTLSASWTEGDKVKVYMGDTEIGELTAQSTGASTKLTGELNVTPSGVLTLKYLSPSYSSQTGTLDFIAANCDYATATVHVKSVSGNRVTLQESSASFTNQQAILKFTLSDNSTLSPSALTVRYGGTTVELTGIPAATYTQNGAGVIFVAIPCNGQTEQAVSLAAVVGSDLYTYETTDITFADSQYYAISVKMTHSNIRNYSYTGAVQAFTAPIAGTYTLEVWGAQGGNRPHHEQTGYGGKGGYATCQTTLSAGETVFIYVGGQGETVPDDNHWNNGAGGAGGWNGGGAGGRGAGTHSGSAGGGGATHISKVDNQIIGSGSGQCASLVGTGFIIVAGGGGGSGHPATDAGAGGGVSGEQGKKYGGSGNPTVAYSTYFYYDISKSYGASGGNGLDASTSAEGAGGGGGGYYGGAAHMSGSTFTTTDQDAGGCGGNSAYNSSLGTNFSTTSGLQSGNGKAVITWYGSTYPTE